MKLFYNDVYLSMKDVIYDTDIKNNSILTLFYDNKSYIPVPETSSTITEESIQEAAPEPISIQEQQKSFVPPTCTKEEYIILIPVLFSIFGKVPTRIAIFSSLVGSKISTF